jgi:hypothetical protein
MQAILLLLEKAAKELSDENLNPIIDAGNDYIYDAKDAQDCKVIYLQLFQFAHHLFMAQKFFPSYCMYRLILKFVDPQDWITWQIATISSIPPTLHFDPAMGLGAGLELINLIRDRNRVPDVKLYPTFLERLHDAATHFRILIPNFSGDKYKTMTLIFLELLIKHGSTSNYPKLDQARAELAALKDVNITVSNLIFLVEYNSSEDNLRALEAKANKNVYDVNQAQLSMEIFHRMQLLGTRLYKEKRYSESVGIYTSSTHFLPALAVQDWLDAMLNTVTAGLKVDPDQAVIMAQKYVKTVNINFATLPAQSHAILENILNVANYFDYLYKPDNKTDYRLIVVDLLNTILKLNTKYTMSKIFPKSDEIVILRNKKRIDLTAIVQTPEEIRKLKIFNGANISRPKQQTPVIPAQAAIQSLPRRQP